MKCSSSKHNHESLGPFVCHMREESEVERSVSEDVEKGGGTVHSGEVQRDEDGKGKCGRIKRSRRPSQGRTSTELHEQ